MESEKNISHSMSLLERSLLNISGVKKLLNFDDKEFLIESLVGVIFINGNNLELIKMDTNTGNICIKGKVNSITYFDDNKRKNNKESLVSRLFK